jgi:hypothetical protein
MEQWVKISDYVETRLEIGDSKSDHRNIVFLVLWC